MRKIWVVLFILLVCLGGCASDKGISEKKDVVVWHWMSDRQSAFEELAERYAQESGVKVDFVLFPHSVYSQKINAAAAARDLPDLFGILGEKQLFGSYINEGLVADLSSYMEQGSPAWKDRFIDITLQFNSFVENNIYDVSPGIYGVPIDFMSLQFLYNEKLLREAGFDSPPDTWDEFISISGKISKKNKQTSGFVCGWGETWYIYCLVTDYAFGVMGEDNFFDTLRGEVSYDNQDWIKVFSLFQDMEQANILAPGIVTLNNKESEQYFATNRAAFAFNGSWGVNAYRDMNPDLEYKVMAPPDIKGEYTPKIWAGAGSSFVVSKSSPNKEKAINFLKWLTEKEQQEFLVKETRNLPSVKDCEEEIGENMKEFLKHKEYFTHPRLWPLTEDSRVVEAINVGVQSIIIGDKTPEEVAKKVEEEKNRSLESE